MPGRSSERVISPDKNLRIALYLPTLDGGGAERVMITLAGHLARRGNHVDLLVATAGGVLLGDVPSNVNVIQFGAKRGILALPALLRYLRSEKPRMIISALPVPNLSSVIAKLVKPSVRVVVTEHNNISQKFSGGGVKAQLLRLLMSVLYKKADAIVAVSDGVADDASRALGIRRSMISRIYNPVVREEIYTAAEAGGATFFGPGPHVVAVGRLEPQKDFQTLVKAFAIVRGKIDASLSILGEGSLKPEIAALIDDLKLHDHVRLVGFQNNPYAWIKDADLLALSSTHEGLPTVLIEALALGTRVVSTDCPSGPREILEDGKWGKLVPVSAPDALAAAIIDSLNEKSAVDVTVRASEFTAERAAIEYESLIYKQPTAKRSGG